MASLRQQIKQRRRALGLRQEDMGQRIGMLRQQYQYLEAKGNPRLDTLELVAKGLDSEVMLIPREKLLEVRALAGWREERPGRQAHPVHRREPVGWASGRRCMNEARAHWRALHDDFRL